MFHSNSKRLSVADIDRSRYTIHMNHLHDHSDPKRERRKAVMPGARKRYTTVCRIVDKTNGATVAWGVAVCSNKDTPSRALGHEIALGRALKDFFEVSHGDPQFGALEKTSSNVHHLFPDTATENLA